MSGVSSWSYSRELPKCFEHPFMFKKKNLACFKDSIVAQAVKTNFHELLERRMKCKECVEAFPGEINFAPLFNLSFLMISETSAHLSQMQKLKKR